MMDQTWLLQLAVQIAPFLLAIVCHEVSHGAMALKYGDTTAKQAGRLTLNPLAHIDPFGTVVFPIITLGLGGVFVGWAKPVPIDPGQFKKLRPGIFWVSFAGPLANFSLALISAALFACWTMLVDTSDALFRPVQQSLYFSTFINVILGAFNMIPIPPLDGSKMLQSLLPTRAAIQFEKLARFGFLIILVLVFTGVIGSILAPVQNISRILIGFFLAVFGVGS
jgi:Zn-dependent protease